MWFSTINCAARARALLVIHEAVLADLIKLALNHGQYTTRVAQTVDSGLYTFKTPEQGAATSVLVATSALLDGTGGRYFEDCNEAVVVDEPTAETPSGVAAYALDPDAAARLWDVSLEALSPRG